MNKDNERPPTHTHENLAEPRRRTTEEMAAIAIENALARSAERKANRLKRLEVRKIPRGYTPLRITPLQENN